MTCAVVIPVYKSFDALTAAEKKSLAQCFLILKRYTIYFTGPQSLVTEGYQQFANRAATQFNYLTFNDRYFKSIEGYNELLLSTGFYKAFEQYNYILLYQPDAYVFKDELAQWCNKGYDYIGAPWFEGFTHPVSTKIIGVGNGGFSLRTPKKYLQLLKRVAALKKLQRMCSGFDSDRFSFFQLFVKLFNSYFNIRSREHLYYLNESDFVNEDVFWARSMGTLFTDFKVAPVEEALQFSFEANPSYLYNLNGKRLPFGCHAWEKHEPSFWQQFIGNEQAQPV